MIKFSEVEFRLLKGSEISRYKNELASIRIETFKDFPYLYEGDFDYEEKYLKVYEQSLESLIVLALHAGTVVGVTTALPLIDETDYLKRPFVENNFSIENIFYFGESILKSQYRGLGIGKKFFEFRESHAMSFRKYNMTCFCAVNRTENHPSKPPNYIPLDNFWVNMGYKKEPRLIASFPWKDIGDTIETEKPMTFWLKEWKNEF